MMGADEHSRRDSNRQMDCIAFEQWGESERLSTDREHYCTGSQVILQCEDDFEAGVEALQQGRRLEALESLRCGIQD